MEKILVVDDEKSMRDFLSIMLKKEGYSVTTAEDGEAAGRLIRKEMFDLVLTDVKMPKIGGLQVLKTVKEASPDTLVLMITAFASTETAIEAMKEGAYDYLTKPFQIEEVKLIIRNALEKKRLRAENRLLRKKVKGAATLEDIIGRSGPMQNVMQVVKKVADTQSNVLILGESGTGKELIAQAIHSDSRRKEKPFVTVNCSALPEPLLESELFGHMKGSFTGAHVNKPGLFETAHEGTIFLDEIGDTPPGIQAKLLRVLEDKEFRRIGGTQNIRVDVRIIAATNKDLEKAVAEGTFREDLYYRLDVIPIHLPPLRERVEDIPSLVRHFLAIMNQGLNKKIRTVTPEAMKTLQAHPWRGNVRELENVLERVVALTTGDTIELKDVTECLQKPMALKESVSFPIPAEGLDLDQVIGDLEKSFLLKALERTNGVKRDAARLLRLNMRSFRYRLEKHGIRKHREPGSPPDDDPDVEPDDGPDKP
ncbi:MAG: sigma-54 dependent transcriptional regulator [Nitrospirota bacterium]